MTLTTQRVFPRVLAKMTMEKKMKKIVTLATLRVSRILTLVTTVV